MMFYVCDKFNITLLIFSFLFFVGVVAAQTGMNCGNCHPNDHNIWMSSHHADTQSDVAEELAGEWAGQSADSVIHGQDAENCIACHSPLAVTANDGMNEVEALNYFFTTSDGLFSDTTQSKNTEDWKHVWCETCHQVPNDHPGSMPVIAIFNSSTAEYDAIINSNVLCGQCHGSLRYEDTDHLRYNAWLISAHGHKGQEDVAEELSGEFAGSTPQEVAAEENCIACHSPTSVLVNGGMTEAEALDHFFTTSDGKFTEETAPQNVSHWPDIACTSCHNPMHPDSIWYFNSSTKEYQTMEGSQELCGQCHGNLRFPDTDHLSYNIESGTGGMGVADTLTMPGVKCVDCHMHAGEEDTKSSMYGGHSWSVFIEEEGGNVTASCTSCHSSMDAVAAENKVEEWQNAFENLVMVAEEKVKEADSLLAGSDDTLKLKFLKEAMHNLEYAESDESGGVHNHNFSMALLNDAVDKADYILTGIMENTIPIIEMFGLYQNYPNPFNSSTTIPFTIGKAGYYTLKLYNIRGQKVMTILQKELQVQDYRIRLNANKISSGVYYYELRGEGRKEIKKFVLMK